MNRAMEAKIREHLRQSIGILAEMLSEAHRTAKSRGFAGKITYVAFRKAWTDCLQIESFDGGQTILVLLYFNAGKNTWCVQRTLPLQSLALED